MPPSRVAAHLLLATLLLTTLALGVCALLPALRAPQAPRSWEPWLRSNGSSAPRQVNVRVGTRRPSERLKALYLRQLRGNPGWRLAYFSFEEALAHLGRINARAARAWEALRPGAYKADVFRLAEIYRAGGLWCDLTLEIHAPLDEALLPGTLLLCAERRRAPAPSVLNGIFSAPPRHPAVKAALDAVLHNVEHRRYGASSLDVTGPQAIGRALWPHLGRPGRSNFSVGDRIPGVRAAWRHLEEGGAIVDQAGRLFASTKAPWHVDEVYGPSGVGYGDLWERREVFLDA